MLFRLNDRQQVDLNRSMGQSAAEQGCVVVRKNNSKKQFLFSTHPLNLPP